jgi:antitoxin component of MazEF toxin-antitoxin module
MVTKLQQTEQGVILLLPEDALKRLGLTAEAEVSITVNPEQGQIIITPATELLPGVDEEFARQVSDFIDQYRPALEALAR